MFNRELFYSLCEKYEVEMSNEYDTAMIRVGEEVKKLDEIAVREIFDGTQGEFTYEKSSNKMISKLPVSFEMLEYTIAC